MSMPITAANRNAARVIEISDTEFFEKYKPIMNQIDPTSSCDGTMFETYGEELAQVVKANNDNPYTVWTLIDGDCWMVVSGMRLVNRLGYFITEVPFEEDELIEVSDPDERDVDE